MDEGSATEAKMSAESRTLARESPIRPMYFEARITRISYTLGWSCDPLGEGGRALHRAKSGRVIYLFFCAPTGHGGLFLPRALIGFRAGQKNANPIINPIYTHPKQIFIC